MSSPGRPSHALLPSRRRWLAPSLWAVTMLVGTSWPNPNVRGVQHADLVVHALLYAVLAFLTARAAAVTGLTARVALAIALAASVFGAVDEWHQQFIPGRSASVSDWVADSVGAVAGVALGYAAFARRRVQPA